MRRRGFTIIELLIYMGLTTAAVLMFMNFMIDVSRVSARSRVAKEVDQQARYVMGRITQDIRGATAVSLSGSTLTLTKPNGAGYDTVAYSLSGTEAQYKLNATAPTSLTAASVRVTALTFTPPTPPSLLWKINMTVESPANVPPSAQKKLTLENSIQPHKSLY